MTKILLPISGALMLIALVLLAIFVIRSLMKKPTDKLTWPIMIFVISSIVALICCPLSEPATWCDHKYGLVEKTPASCTENGEKIQHCSLCDTNHTEKLKALGHKMVEVSRVEIEGKSKEKVTSECKRCGHKETEKVELTYIKDVTFDEIYLAYDENPLRAADKYEGNRYRITAKINEMSDEYLLDFDGESNLIMETLVDKTYVFFYAKFEKEQEEILKTVNKGDTITFEGTCEDSGNWSDCEIIVE